MAGAWREGRHRKCISRRCGGIVNLHPAGVNHVAGAVRPRAQQCRAKVVAGNGVDAHFLGCGEVACHVRAVGDPGLDTVRGCLQVKALSEEGLARESRNTGANVAQRNDFGARLAGSHPSDGVYGFLGVGV